MLRAFAAVLAALLGVASFAACGGDDFSSDGGEPAGPCNEDPWSCASGQTCWPNADENGFVCLNGASGIVEGASCELFAGTVTCGPTLFCAQSACRRFCDPEDPNRACPDGQICSLVPIQNVAGTVVIGEVQVCTYPPG
jgi:hypothetical protein